MLPLTTEEVSAGYLTSHVLIIDDQSTSLNILSAIVNSIHLDVRVKTCSKPIEALQHIRQHPPELIITDYMMPDLNGIDLTRQVREIPGCKNIPIIMVTIMKDKTLLHEALESGVTDFLQKPVDHNECKARCRNLLELARHQNRLEQKSNILQQEVNDNLTQIHVRERETLNRLTQACTYKDCITGKHLARIGKLSKLIALKLGLPEYLAELIEVASPLHDIGKIAIPDNILLKRGKLTDGEFTVMKTHTTIGYEILKDSPSPYLQTGALIALNHHEKYDGRGYPYGQIGEEIPLEARIVTVADVFDSLTNHRPYKKAWPLDETLGFITGEKGRHFDPDCVEALFSVLSDSEKHNSLALWRNL